MLSVFLIETLYPAVVVQHLCAIESPYCSATHPMSLHSNSGPCFLCTTKKSNLCESLTNWLLYLFLESSMPFPQMTIRASMLDVISISKDVVIVKNNQTVVIR